MKITKRQLRSLIETLLLEQAPVAGYMVPHFETEEDMMLFLDELDPDDQINADVINPLTGEIVMMSGETPHDAGLVELETEEEVETDPDELDHFDWGAWEREREAERQAKRDAYEKVLSGLEALALTGGEDWAMDTMHDAVATPRMWQSQASSAAQYAEGVGEDAAGDLADALLQYNSDPEVQAVYQSLADREGMGVYGGGYGQDEAGRPTKSVMKEIIADSVYEGILKGIKKYQEKYGEELP